MKYYSDKQKGSRPRKQEIVGDTVWAGIVAQIQSQVLNCGFAQRYPELCPDGAGPVATNEKMFAAALQAEIPGSLWPLETLKLSEDGFTSDSWAPETETILDIIEFCHKSISKAIQGSFHSYFNHYHLTFDEEVGKAEFRETINTIFERNAIAFELKDSGSIERIISGVLSRKLRQTEIQTKDETLDKMLGESIRKIQNPRFSIRHEAIERLWDAWERLKSLKDEDKKASIKQILDLTSAEPSFRELLEQEARDVTEIGNVFQIRHSETTKVPITKKEQVDYLFHRLFSLIALILEKIE